ncbi:MAG: short-chain fatty acyl-CoA regulator family protein [Paracoccaceae bacterium]
MTGKVFAGARLAEIRQGLGLTQTDFARQLGISLSYMNQMERNNRPLSRDVAGRLAERFDVDIAVFALDDADRLAADLTEALADPVFRETAPSTAERQLVARSAPRLAHAFLALHRAYRQGQERLARMDEALDRPTNAPWPWEEVRDFFHYCDNYLDAIDKAAETFSQTIGFTGPDRLIRAVKWLADKHGVETVLDGKAQRAYDPGTRRLALSAQAEPGSQAFRIAHQIALIDYDDLLEATLDFARFHTGEARQIAKIGLANYFAGAALLPYRVIAEAARELRHDIEALAHRFGVSLEQIGHRLSTLQRPENKGIPFFFARVDQAGTITKRHSATRLQFARFGGACPLWNVHQAFEQPGRILRQLAETPDGSRYLCLARDITRSTRKFQSKPTRHAIALGCEISYAAQLVYADDMDLAAPFEPIGVSCRICEREDCHQRSVPPVERRLKLNPNRRDSLPYRLG